MPKVVDREEMQHGILDAAMQVYSKKGYHAATIADVAEAAGLGKGTLYLYFKNKEAIAISMVERHFKGMEDRFFGQKMPDSLDEFADSLSQTMNIPDEQSKFIRVFFEVFGPSFASDTFSAKVASFFDKSFHTIFFSMINVIRPYTSISVKTSRNKFLSRTG